MPSNENGVKLDLRAFGFGGLYRQFDLRTFGFGGFQGLTYLFQKLIKVRGSAKKKHKP